MITKNDYTLEAEFEKNSNKNEEPLHVIFDRKADSNPKGISFIDSVVSHTFSEIKRYSEALASWMIDQGIGKGDVVSLHIPSSAEFAIANIAASRIGALVSPLHMTYGEKELKELISFSGAKLLISDTSYSGKDLSEKVKGVVESTNINRVLINGDREFMKRGWDNFWEICKSQRIYRNLPKVMASDPIGLFFTSGTETGEPKGCIHTHSSLMGNALSVCRDAEIDENGIIMSGSAFSHLFGLLSMHLSLISGSINVIVKRFHTDEFYSAAERHKPTHVFLVPAELRDLLDLLGKPGDPFSEVKEFRIAGAMLPEEIALELMKKTKGNLVNHWGMTELGAGSYTRHGDSREIVAGTIGKPVQGAQIAILSEDGRFVINETGEILYRGPSLFKGYYKLSRYIDEFIYEINGEKWFKTGDLGMIDVDGNVRYMGRKKDIINRGGMKINSKEVERILERMKGIEAACIVPVPDTRLGDKACLFYSTTEKIGRSEITEYLSSMGVAKYKWPEYFVVENSMPRTPTGKIAKGKLIEIAREMFSS